MTPPIKPFRSEFRSLLAIAGPMGLSQFAQMLMGLTDDVLLGGLGATALAIGGLATGTFFTLTAILAAVIEAGGILLAQARGRQDHASLAPSSPPCWWWPCCYACRSCTASPMWIRCWRG
ncbi:MATE family efflux transporter [Komagataeibacter kakiaceti]|uniref:MATE family efflux transporter n=1 Tax=Komagataeibacter kakiaceti TaxID=943261 RepID=UPI000AF8F840|nr:MATE family efflux transporter [Komagataeibacter kakiaceti]